MSILKLKIKKGDHVKVIAGSMKGKTGKIIATLPKQTAVKVEGLNIVKKHTKPNLAHPQGGIVEIHQPINISKVALIIDGKNNTTSRIGYVTKKDGSKIRITKANNKEIDV